MSLAAAPATTPDPPAAGSLTTAQKAGQAFGEHVTALLESVPPAKLEALIDTVLTLAPQVVRLTVWERALIYVGLGIAVGAFMLATGWRP